MRTLPLNLVAFFTAAVLVIAVSFAMVQAGVFGEDDGASVVINPTQTPAVLQSSATPTQSEPLETASAGEAAPY